jgi:hypothetical protein
VHLADVRGELRDKAAHVLRALDVGGREGDHRGGLTPPPGVGDVPRLDVGSRDHEQLDVLHPGLRARAVGRQLLDLERQVADVVAGEVDEPAGDGRRARHAQVGQPAHHPVGRLLPLRRVEEANVADRRDRRGKRVLRRDPGSAEEGEHRVGCGVREVGDDVRDRVVVERLGVPHEDKPAPAEEAKGVACAGDVDGAVTAGRELLDRLLGEMGPKARYRGVHLGPVAAGDEIRNPQVRGHASLPNPNPLLELHSWAPVPGAPAALPGTRSRATAPGAARR